MEQRSRFNSPGRNTTGHQGVIDRATLYLCRQGRRWMVVIDSPRVSRALPLRPPVGDAYDAYDARSQLLSIARRACPDAAIMSTDGALERADYEWRVDVRGTEARPGDLGEALDRALSTESAGVGRTLPETFGRRCHWGHSPVISGRPRTF